ncbi:MAG TPA: SRPBCC family protein [Acidimicrobiales bacterium]|nr:SRPBCC family protein [Acidimicrobiales bacterium]
MGAVRKSITIDRPVTTVYNQWTQFEEFPRFMEGVESVQQLDEKRLHWVAEIGGTRREWDAEITEQTPDRRIAWQAIGGKKNRGAVSFRPEGAGRTTIELEMEYETEGLKEKAGDALGVIDRRVEGDLKRFEKFIEARGTETGAWRGSV